MDVEFKCSLDGGFQDVFVMAIVTDSVEIVRVMTSDDSDGAEIPLKFISPQQMDILEYWASQEAYEQERRNKEEAV